MADQCTVSQSYKVKDMQVYCPSFCCDISANWKPLSSWWHIRQYKMPVFVGIKTLKHVFLVKCTYVSLLYYVFMQCVLFGSVEELSYSTTMQSQLSKPAGTRQKCLGNKGWVVQVMHNQHYSWSWSRHIRHAYNGNTVAALINNWTALPLRAAASCFIAQCILLWLSWIDIGSQFVCVSSHKHTKVLPWKVTASLSMIFVIFMLQFVNSLCNLLIHSMQHNLACFCHW